MSVRPIDIKTTLLVSEDASRLREAQKAQEAGLAEQVAQNKHAHDQKTDTVQKPDGVEGAIIRKEDEEAESGKNRQTGKSAQPDKDKDKDKDKEEEEKKEHPVIPDGTRGQKIDLKA